MISGILKKYIHEQKQDIFNDSCLNYAYYLTDIIFE